MRKTRRILYTTFELGDKHPRIIEVAVDTTQGQEVDSYLQVQKLKRWVFHYRLI